MDDQYLLALSLLFVCTGIFSFTRSTFSRLQRFMLFCIIVFWLVIFLLYYSAHYFTGNGIDEATLYHVTYGLEGIAVTDYVGLIISVLTVLMIGIVGSAWLLLRTTRHTKKSLLWEILTYILLLLAIAFHPGFWDIVVLTQSKTLSAPLNPQQRTEFSHYYRTPQLTQIDEKTKNIVVIYAESLERTYFDETLFPGLITELREIENISTSFSDITQTQGASWTMGGLTATLCGMPLITPSHGNAMGGMNEFLPAAVCLGDLLQADGYQLSFVGGADLAFAGKGKFLKNHGFDQMVGTQEILPTLETPPALSEWGLPDTPMLEYAYTQFEKLSQQNRPFGLFTLTLNTHRNLGDLPEFCADNTYGDGTNDALNRVACSDHLIASFVQRILSSPYTDNLTIVIASDHLAMANEAYDTLSQTERRNLFLVLDPAKKEARKITTPGSTLDFAPTLLPFLGYTGNVGLGRDLRAENVSTDTAFIQSQITQWTEPLTSFWNFPIISQSLELNANNRTAVIDGKNFDMPLLIELDDSLQSILKFDFYLEKGHTSLLDHRRNLSDDAYFILVEECENVSNLSAELGTEGYCLLAGQGSRLTYVSQLSEQITSFSRNEILDILRIPHDGTSPSNTPSL